MATNPERKRMIGRLLERQGGVACRRRKQGVVACEVFEPRQFFSVSPADASSLSVTVGPHLARFASFQDAQGNSNIFALKGPGTATVNFVGSSLSATIARGGGQLVGGTGISVTSVSITGSNRHTSVLFTLARHTSARAPLPIPDFSADGAIGALSGNIDVTGALTVNGTLGKVVVAGLDGGTTTDPNSGAVVATSLTASSIGSLSVADNLGENISVSGAIGSVVIRGNVTGNISAAIIKSLTVGGNVTGSTITAGQPLIRHVSDLGRLTVTGTMLNSTVNAAGNIGPIAVGTLSNDNIEAGVTLPVGVSGLPTTLGEFTSDATISSVKTHGAAGTDIAAFTIGKVALGSLQTANSGVQFGIAGNTIAQVTGIASINGRKFNIRKLVNEGTVAADLAKLGLVAANVDFTIAVI